MIPALSRLLSQLDRMNEKLDEISREVDRNNRDIIVGSLVILCVILGAFCWLARTL